MTLKIGNRFIDEHRVRLEDVKDYEIVSHPNRRLFEIRLDELKKRLIECENDICHAELDIQLLRSTSAAIGAKQYALLEREKKETLRNATIYEILALICNFERMIIEEKQKKL